MMRSFITGITAAAVMLLAVSASAATTAVLWTEIDGSPIGATPSIAINPGQTATATFYLDGTPDATGINNYSISLQWDGGAVPVLGSASAIDVVPVGYSGSFSPGVAVTDSGAGTMGSALGYDAFVLLGGVLGGPYSIGTLTVTALNPGVTTIASGAFQPLGADGIVNGAFADITGSTVWGSAGITVIPEPTTASLLGIGLLGLALAGRRR